MPGRQRITVACIALLVVFCGYAVYAKNTRSLHPKLKTGTYKVPCYCNSLDGCVASPYGVSYCGAALVCSYLNPCPLSAE